MKSMVVASSPQGAVRALDLRIDASAVVGAAPLVEAYLNATRGLLHSRWRCGKRRQRRYEQRLWKRETPPFERGGQTLSRKGRGMSLGGAATGVRTLSPRRKRRGQ